MNIYQNITELIGNTPIIKLNKYQEYYRLEANILAKLEYFNPGGSVKDRIAFEIIEQAEKEGRINHNTVIIEPTSGNTGIGLSSIAAAKGYKVIITMPETMSIERRKIMKAYGAELVLTPGPLGMKGAIEKARELAIEIPNSFIPGQFENKNNPLAHYKTTGPEIWEQTGGKVDIFIAGIGTGGTISGAGKYLRGKNPDIEIIGIEPKDSAVLTKNSPGPHKIQGLGAGFVPDTLNKSVYDEIMTVSTTDAFKASRELSAQEGILTGISSGAALYVATEVAKRPENKGKNIVVILPDTGERYLSTALFE